MGINFSDYLDPKKPVSEQRQDTLDALNFLEGSLVELVATGIEGAEILLQGAELLQLAGRHLQTGIEEINAAHEAAIKGGEVGENVMVGIVPAHNQAINGSSEGGLGLKGIVPAHKDAVGVSSQEGWVESIYTARKGAVGKGEWHGELGIEGYRDATLKKIDGSIQYLADDIFGRVMARLGLSGEPQRDPKFDGSGNSAV